MTTFLIILTTLVFFLSALVFGVHGVMRIKENLALGLGFLSAFIYTAFCFAIQINGMFECGFTKVASVCIQFPDVNQIPLTRIGFNLISQNMKIFLMNILTLGIVFFLIYFLKKYKKMS